MHLLHHPGHPARAVRQPQHSVSHPQVARQERSDGPQGSAAAVERRGGEAERQPGPPWSDRRSACRSTVCFDQVNSYLVGTREPPNQKLMAFIFHLKTRRSRFSALIRRRTWICRLPSTCQVLRCWKSRRTCGQRYTPSSANLVRTHNTNVLVADWTAVPSKCTSTNFSIDCHYRKRLKQPPKTACNFSRFWRSSWVNNTTLRDFEHCQEISGLQGKFILCCETKGTKNNFWISEYKILVLYAFIRTSFKSLKCWMSSSELKVALHQLHHC